MFGREKQPQTPPHTSKMIFLLFCLWVVFLIWWVGWRFGSLGTLFQQAKTTALIRIIYPLDTGIGNSLAAGHALLTKTFTSHSPDELLQLLVTPRKEKKWPLMQVFAKTFPRQFTLISDLSNYYSDLHELLWFSSPQHYLILLQNTAEKRPNGGFFGSFAFVTLEKGTVSEFRLSDSYHPLYDRPQSKVLGPERLTNFLPDRDIYFVSANKIWFTYQDGVHIQKLYEKSYPGTKIRGVIFLRTDMFESLIPGFTEQLRQRQYINATIDLIRGEQKWWKKMYYLHTLEEFLQTHKTELFKELFVQLPDLLDRRLINVYLDTISPSLEKRLRENQLTTRFEETKGYFRDSNTSYSKIDRFVSKQITLKDIAGTVVGTWSGDIITLPALMTWEIYTRQIDYHLLVPAEYQSFIRQMNTDYEIVLWAREEHILGLDYLRSTRGVVYLPWWTKPLIVSGDIAEWTIFKTPFSRNAMYHTKIDGNDKKATVTIEFEVVE